MLDLAGGFLQRTMGNQPQTWVAAVWRLVETHEIPMKTIVVSTVLAQRIFVKEFAGIFSL